MHPRCTQCQRGMTLDSNDGKPLPSSPKASTSVDSRRVSSKSARWQPIARGLKTSHPAPGCAQSRSLSGLDVDNVEGGIRPGEALYLAAARVKISDQNIFRPNRSDEVLIIHMLVIDNAPKRDDILLRHPLAHLDDLQGWMIVTCESHPRCAIRLCIPTSHSSRARRLFRTQKS